MNRYRLMRVLLIASCLAATVGAALVLPVFFPFVAGFKFVQPFAGSTQLGLNLMLGFGLTSTLALAFNSLNEAASKLRYFSFRKARPAQPAWLTSNSTITLAGASQR